MSSKGGEIIYKASLSTIKLRLTSMGVRGKTLKMDMVNIT
jgi:hypothetical protein